MSFAMKTALHSIVRDAPKMRAGQEGEPSSLSQTVKGLEPGRKYCLQFATFDVRDVKANRIAPRRFGIAATLSEGVEIDKALSWVHGGFCYNTRRWNDWR